MQSMPSWSCTEDNLDSQCVLHFCVQTSVLECFALVSNLGGWWSYPTTIKQVFTSIWNKIIVEFLCWFVLCFTGEYTALVPALQQKRTVFELKVQTGILG